MKLPLLALLIALSPACFAESEAMQRERALNRILVAERLQREREAAAHGNGLMGIKPAAKAAAADPKKPHDPSRTPKSHRSKKAAQPSAHP